MEYSARALPSLFDKGAEEILWRVERREDRTDHFEVEWNEYALAIRQLEANVVEHFMLGLETAMLKLQRLRGHSRYLSLLARLRSEGGTANYSSGLRARR